MNNVLNVLYQSSDSYAPIMGTSIISLLENNKHIFELNIYILNDNISNLNLKKLNSLCESYNRKLLIIETEGILNQLKNLNVAAFGGRYTTFFKLMAISHIHTSNRRILQIDCDTIVDGPLDELCELDLDGYLLAATYDCTMNEYKELIGIPLQDKFYNGGVLLINQKEWIDDKCEKQIIHHLKNVRSSYYTADQDILNVLFRKKFKYLSLKYNFNSGFYIYGIKESLKLYNLEESYFSSEEEIFQAAQKPIIYHCMGAMTGRPWEKDSIHPQNEIFRRYKEMSPWKDTPLVSVERKRIFRIQRFLYKNLPSFLYIPIHKFVQYRYLNNMNKEVQKK